MAQKTGNSIDAFGDPLAFKVAQGARRPAVVRNEAGTDVIKVEARHLSHHQKEAVVTEGSTGSAWRIASDEGPQLGGTNLAPFPLGVFNAGLHGDLVNRILAVAGAMKLPIDGLDVYLENRYSLTGSFVRGDAVGEAEPTRIRIALRSDAGPAEVLAMIRRAMAASPAMAALRTPLENTFAIYVNGRRRTVSALPASTAADASDPFMVYSRPPRPLDAAADFADLIVKGANEPGTRPLSPASPTGRVVRPVIGKSRLVDPAGVVETDTWLGLPGSTHFAIRTDERPGLGRAGDQGPSGLACVAAGVAFCYTTQLLRYIENMKLAIGGVRMVQYTPYRLAGSLAGGDLVGAALPVDTHLFLNGEAPDEIHEKLQKIAAVTCYLHASLAAALAPEVVVELNGQTLS
ncbi:MAG: hypothetical protein ACK515_05675 [bacterium]|jgi:hypothetical protein|nr:hypothetical protein [Betaproteobacteria bacterium]